MAHRQHQDAGAEADPAGAGGGPGQRQYRIPEDRRGRIHPIPRQDDVLADPDIGKAEFLRLDRGAADRVGRGFLADMGQMDAEAHIAVHSLSLHDYRI